MAKKIYINPGHSDRDPGAIKYAVERELNVKVSNYQKDYLLANYECEIRMNPGSIDSLTTISNDANAWGADLFVSNHFNAAGGDGYEALVYSEARVPLGKIFEKHVKAIGQNSRGVKLRPGLAVLRLTTMPAVLNEGAFVDNWNDIKDWDEDHELKKMGEAYAKACAEALDLPKKKPIEPAPKPETDATAYSLTNFVKDVQKATGSIVDGIAGPQTLSKTIDVSAKENNSHAVVKCIQKRLYALGYVEVGDADGIAGPKFTSAVAHYQQDHVDGTIEAGDKTWKKLLGMI